MQSDQADQASKTGHPRLWVAGLVLLTLVAALSFLLRDGSTTLDPPSPDETSALDSESGRAAATAELLSELTAALTEGSRAEAVALAAPGNDSAARALGFIHDNVNELGIDELSTRYVDEAAADLSPSDGASASGRRWAADVEIAWQIADFDTDLSQMEVALTFEETSTGAAFVSVGQENGGRAPLWMLSDLAVEQSRRALVMVTDEGQAADFLAKADKAVADVKGVLPEWRGRLVVQVPESQNQLNRVIGGQENAYDSIAAVTSTVDGSVSPTAPAHILVNPQVFGRLGPDGAQIVMSHEATHVATNAATSGTPMWLLEGFADYVALAHVDLPVTLTASQILAEVRKSGPPANLPAAREFDPSNKLLGTAYESAWLACRYLAEEYGEQKLVEFYNAVDGGASTQEAFRSILGTTVLAFTRGWQAYLRQLSS